MSSAGVRGSTPFKILRNLYGLAAGAPKYYLGPAWLNAAGFQVARIAIRTISFNLRPRVVSTDVEQYVRALDTQGFVTIPDFLPNEVFRRLEAAFENVRHGLTTDNLDYWQESAIQATTGFVRETDESGRFIAETLGRNEVNLRIVSAAMRRRVRAAPSVRFEHLRLPEGCEDRNRDPGSELHADKFFPSIKVLLCISDCTEDTGATIYCPGSHKMTSLARIRHEYTHSVNDAKMRAGFGLKPIEWYTGAAWGFASTKKPFPVPEEARKAMDLRPMSLVAPKNTLVIANYAAFHRRGTMKPGSERKQLRMVFHGLEAPWFAKRVTQVVGFLRRRANRSTAAAG
jgi:hypothetical protein